MTSQPTLFPTGPVARTSDPETSRAAGASQPISSELHRLILDQFDWGQYTDDELVEFWPSRCPGTIKKRRTELAKAGVLVDSGKTRPTRTGATAIVWRLA